MENKLAAIDYSVQNGLFKYPCVTNHNHTIHARLMKEVTVCELWSKKKKCKEYSDPGREDKMKQREE